MVKDSESQELNERVIAQENLRCAELHFRLGVYTVGGGETNTDYKLDIIVPHAKAAVVESFRELGITFEPDTKYTVRGAQNVRHAIDVLTGEGINRTDVPGTAIFFPERMPQVGSWQEKVSGISAGEESRGAK